MKITTIGTNVPSFKGAIDISDLAKPENVKYLNKREESALMYGKSYVEKFISDAYTLVFKRSKKNPEIIDVFAKDMQGNVGAAIKGKRINANINGRGLRTIGFQQSSGVLNIIDKAIINLERTLGLGNKKKLEVLTNLAKRMPKI